MKQKNEANLKSASFWMNLKLGIYRHFKGNEYEVVAIAKHSETLDDYIVYRALYGEQGLWVRPLKMFAEEVEINGKKMPRFRHIK